MTNEETLNLLKPIMLDGTEKVGNKVYSLKDGDTQIYNIIPIENLAYPLVVSGCSYTQYGYSSLIGRLPTLFKVNPFEWLAKQNNSQERVIEAYHGKNGWVKRVLHCVKNGRAICWDGCESIDEAKDSTWLSTWTTWRELPTKITKEEALNMCDEIGVDVKDMLLNALSESGVDTTNLIIE